MQLHVFKRWGYTPIDDNDADAYALMKLGALWLRWQGDDAAATKAHSKMFGALEALHGKGSPSDSTPRVPAKAGRKAARHA
jgi:UDP-2,3-diacylglucosamine pyrophosphatase LpxH